MSEVHTFAQLIRASSALYDSPGSPLPDAASTQWVRGFSGGAAWMRLALESIRGESLERHRLNAAAIGYTKYGLALLAAIPPLLTWLSTGEWLVLPLVVLSFYAVEAQFVFSFPLAIDGDPHPLLHARALTIRAGGTLQVMATVIPIAAFMLFGGFLRQGFLRSWCIGCLSVVLLYERARDINHRSRSDAQSTDSTPTTRVLS